MSTFLPATYNEVACYRDPNGLTFGAQLNQPLPVAPGGLRASPNFWATAASDTAAVVTLPAPPPNQAWMVSGVWWSYTTAGAGNLTINDGADQFDIDITAAGPGFIPFATAMTFAPGASVTLTIAAVASSVGKAGFIGAQVITALVGNPASGASSPSSVILIPGI